MLFRTLGFALLLVLFCPDFILGKHKNAIELKKCYLKDKTKFSDCLFTFWKGINEIFKTGIPELNVPVIDPYFIHSAEYKDQGAILQANVKFTNITAIGASNVVVNTVHLDPKARTVTVNATLPYLNCTGNYTMKGKVVVLTVDSSGRTTVNMTGVKLFVKGHMAQKGTGVRTDKTEVVFTANDAFIKFDDLLGGDQVGNALNALISENGKQLFQDLEPLIGGLLEDAIQKVIENVFSDIPPEAFFS